MFIYAMTIGGTTNYWCDDYWRDNQWLVWWLLAGQPITGVTTIGLNINVVTTRPWYVVVGAMLQQLRERKWQSREAVSDRLQHPQLVILRTQKSALARLLFKTFPGDAVAFLTWRRWDVYAKSFILALALWLRNGK
jgi:hypothetical protein